MGFLSSSTEKVQIATVAIGVLTILLVTDASNWTWSFDVLFVFVSAVCLMLSCFLVFAVTLELIPHSGMINIICHIALSPPLGIACVLLLVSVIQEETNHRKNLDYTYEEILYVGLRRNSERIYGKVLLKKCLALIMGMINTWLYIFIAYLAYKDRSKPENSTDEAAGFVPPPRPPPPYFRESSYAIPISRREGDQPSQYVGDPWSLILSPANGYQVPALDPGGSPGGGQGPETTVENVSDTTGTTESIGNAIHGAGDNALKF